jgi:hypothetical protein
MACGGFSIIHINDATSIWLMGVAPSSLTAANFQFS